MSEQATLLLLDRDPATVETFRTTVEVERRVKLLVSLAAPDALRIAREVQPDLIVFASEITGMNALAFCQQVRQDPALEASMLVMIIPRGANDLRFAGLTYGVDEYLTRPVEPAEVLTKLHAMLRLKRVNDQLRADKVQLEELHQNLRASFDQLLQLMVRMLDMRLPGAADRGQRIAALARQVAARFGVPETHLRDLEIAARLHELGRIVSQDGADAGTERAPDDRRYILGTRSIFSKVEGLSGAAELTGAVYENWDGSGYPDHLQLGQIPLRSRILRILIDLFQALSASSRPTMEVVLELMQNHVGTRYDPMVMVHLRAVLSGTSDDVRGRQQFVPVTELEVGMVLAQDLLTDSGIKLLASGTRITAEKLEVIRRRHSLEPIVQGAAVFRRAA